jgi:predicted DNA-binding transcriptional regulator AlpA
LSRHREEFPEELMLGSGKSKLISDEGIEWIKKHIKKEASSPAVELLTGINT